MQNLSWNTPNPVVRAINARQGDDGDSEATCLPSDLLAATPDCALSCVLDFAVANYQENTCPFTSSLTYLCTSTTSSGLTIGEGSIQCLASRCTGNDLKRIGVYKVCDSVTGAIPQTASVITATIEPATTASTMATPLPPTIGNPTYTQDVTSIVMASGVPSMALPTTASTGSSDPNTTSLPSVETLQPSSTTTSNDVNPSGSAVAVVDRASRNPGLSSAQIAGIGVGAAFVTLLILAIVFWRCRRREKLQRRRSMRWSMHGARTPPPNYGSPPDVPVMAKAPDNTLLSAAPSNQRFYSAAPVEEKRRSFWRKSIKPEDIGVAVSPHVETSSPASFSSQQSMTKLLPKVPEKLPARATKGLWPAPLNFETVRSRQSLMLRPTSEVTVFDEDLEANASFRPPRLSEARDSVSITPVSKGKRERITPIPLQLNPVNLDSLPRPSIEKEPSTAARIPLTPTYDNGNFVHSEPRSYPPSSWRQTVALVDPFSPPPLSALPEELSSTTNIQAHRNVLRKKTVPNSATKVEKGDATVNSAEPKPGPHRKDSATTVATDIEEDTTPEEVEKQLELLEKPRPAAITTARTGEYCEGPRSPISNLKYPAIPRSAGISRQAEYVALPPRNLAVPSIQPRRGPSLHKRDQLVRNEASFVVTETTSSDGYLSDRSIEWPVPPAAQASHNSLKAGMLKLRENPSSTNRGSTTAPAQRSMDQTLRFGTRSSSLMPPPATVSKAKLAPATSPAGDLYFKVEM